MRKKMVKRLKYSQIYGKMCGLFSIFFAIMIVKQRYNLTFSWDAKPARILVFESFFFVAKKKQIENGQFIISNDGKYDIYQIFGAM